MGSDTEKTPVKLEGKSDEDEKPIGSLFKVRKSRVSHRKKTDNSENRVEDMVSCGEINDTLASIKKKLKRPKSSSVKATFVVDPLVIVKEEVIEELQSAEIGAGSASVKSGNKRLRIDVGDEETGDSLLGASDEAGLEDSLSVLFKRPRKVKNQGSDKLAEASCSRILVESAEECQQISVTDPEQETKTTSIKDEEDVFPENAKEVQGLEVGLSHCSAGLAQSTVDKCVQEEGILGANIVSKTEEKEKSEGSPVKEHLEEIQNISREEISQQNVVSGIHEIEKIEVSSVKECLEELPELPKGGEVADINPVSEENIDSTCRPSNEQLDTGNFIINDNIRLPPNKAFEISTNSENTLEISIGRLVPGTPDSTRAEADDMSPNRDEAITNEPPAAFHVKEATEPICEDHENHSVLLRARNAKKRRHDDMAYEGDADWEVVVNEQGLFNNLPVDQPDQSFKSRDQYLLIKEEEANDGYVAAVAAGLKARAATPIEKLKFKELLRRKGGFQEYLECRNMILSRWRKEVRHILPLSRCGVSDTPLQDESHRESLIREIYLFLNQNGYINAGIASEKEACKFEVEPNFSHFEDMKKPELNESNGFKLTIPENDLAPDPVQANLPGNTTLDGYEVSTCKDKFEPFGTELPSSNETNRKTIIIVGAGPSGLAAARHLHRQGFCVTILEARDRIGGRVHTDRTSLSVPVDLGASIITGVEADVATERQPDPSSLICSQLSLELTVLNSDCPLYDLVTGEKVPPELDEALESEYNTLLDEMALLVAHHGEKSAQLSLEHGLEYGLRKHRNSGFAPSVIECDGLDEIVKSRDGTDVLTPMERRVMNWHFAHLEYGCATMLKEVSLPNWNQDDAYGGFGGAHCMIKGGFSTVVENLAKGLDVRLSHVVTEVHYEEKKVKVCTSNGSAFEGDAVLVTVPLGCLKASSIKFSPDLPEWKKMSIKRLGFGVLNKVILEFPTVFWDETVDYFGATAEETDLRGRCFMFWNVKKTCDAPVLIALVAGKAAVDGQNISPVDHVAHAMMVLRRIFSKVSVPEPIGSVVTNWGSEPFTRGSYSYVAVGASGEDYDILGRPVANCLFFAGEATCKEHPDTVGGAMLSGVREAVRIIDLLQAGRDFVSEVEAMESASKTANKRSDHARNEVRDMSRRLEACDLSSDMLYPSVSKEALLREMFFNAKTTSGRLLLAKELFQLPVDALKSFAGSKEGLSTLNSWILDSLGKNSTQLLRHCVRLLVLVSIDLVAVRLSGIGRTVKEKVCVHTSRDIRAIASQLVRVWIEVFRKEKASNGRLRLLKFRDRDPQSKISKSNKRPEGRAMRSEATLDVKSEASSLRSQRTAHALDSEAKLIPIMSEEEAAAFAAAEAARAAAIAAAQAYASAEAEKAALELPKIPSFHKFANRLQAEESDPRRRHLSGDPENHSRAPTCQNLDIPRMPTNSNACPTIREDAIECSGVPENRVIFTKAWVDVDPVRVDGVKDASAVERWQEQAFEVDTDFYNRLHIPERDEPGEATAALQNAARQGQGQGQGQGGSVGSQPADSKKNSEGRSHGVEHIKQGIMEYVATLLKPLYKTNKLDRDGYKAIMKKSVTKVMEQLSEAEKGMSAFEFLNFKRKNKIRDLVDKLIERQMQAKGAAGS